MSRRKHYCDNLEHYTTDLDLFPLISVCSDGKGRLGIFADKILTHEQKIQLMFDAIQHLHTGIEKEKDAIQHARILKPHEYRKVD